MLRVVALMGLALQALPACTTRDPLYCDDRTPCPGGQTCNVATRTCEPAADLGPPRPRGESCSLDAQCSSGHCVDRVCCETRCDGPCRSCALPGARGTCGLSPDGPDPRSLCTGSGTSCGGSCREGACVYPPSGQPCGDPACAAGKLRVPGCDGAGACAGLIRDCGGYVCAGSAACKQSCSGAADCLPPFECVAGSCAASLPLGSECGQNPKACASGSCVDGVCCEKSTCPSCQACNLAAKGTCSPIVDGTSCGATSCASGIKKAPLCASGSCSSQTLSCGLYACNGAGTDCLSACGGAAGCGEGAYCEATVCKPRKPNGESCGSGAECLSGLCTSTEKVCCDAACAGDCETCAGKSGCAPRPAGTPCGDQKLACDDQPQSSSVTQPRCDGARACVPTVVQSCTPYRCRAGSGAPACGTACATHADCTTLCDPFLAKSSCRPSTEVCFADVKVCPQQGAGSQASPFCKIRDCLDAMAGRKYVAVADGKYLENLSAKSSPLAIISTGTSGPLWNGQSFQARVLLQPALPATAGVEVGQGEVYLSGIDLSHAPPSSPPQPGDPSGLLVQLLNAQLTLRTSHLHHGNALHCLDAIGSKLRLEDVVLDACTGAALSAEKTDAWLQDVGIFWSGAGLSFDGGSLTMRDVILRFNGGGLHTYKAKLDLDRVRTVENGGDGLVLENGTTGQVVNLLVHGNVGKGIRFFFNPAPPAFINVTVTKNGGLELEGDSYDHGTVVVTRFWNSIIWDAGTAVQGPFEFLSSDVNAMLPFNSTSINKDPIFVGTQPEPYALHPSSPCVDRGDDAAPGLPSLDLLKAPRQIDRIPGGGKVDLGALELQP